MKLLSRSKGEIAMLKVQLKIHEKNLVCSIPTNNELYYDLIIDNPNNSGEIARAQVKYCNRMHEKHLQLRLDSNNSKRIFYRSTDIDIVLVYIPKLDVILKYEKKHFHRRKRIQINLDNPKSKWHYKRYIWN